MIALEDFKNYVEYNPLTGSFIRTAIVENNSKSFLESLLGKEIKNTSSNGYIEISVGSTKYSAHKLAWYFYYGYYPDFHLDHINGDKQDNKIENLRKSTPLQNMRNRGKNKNNSTGFNGVYKSRNKYRARIKVNGKLVNLGTFDKLEDAVIAREKANEEYGFDPNHGKRESW